MKYMLDTNTCIYIIKHKPAEVLRHFLKYEPGDICISEITNSELLYGVEKSTSPDRNRLALTLFLSEMIILPYDSEASKEYGIIRTDLERKGTPIGPMDMLIAAHAKSKELILVTNNEREFRRVKELNVENWCN